MGNLEYHRRTMFGPLGISEVILILVLALLIFGPKRLPEMGRTIGKGLAEFRKASTDFKRTINTELALDESEQSQTARRPALAGTVTVLDPPTPAAIPQGTTARGSVAEPEPPEPAGAGPQAVPPTN